MFKIYSKIIFVLILCGSLQMNAQSRRINNEGGELDRSIGAGQRYNTPRKAKPVDYVKLTVDNLTEKLNLDGFQSAILRKIVMDYNENLKSIMDEVIPNEAKQEKINIEKNQMDVKITEILNDKQKVAFNDLKKSNKSPKSKKKNKKKKQSEAEESESELF